jgi:hypothetical protein
MVEALAKEVGCKINLVQIDLGQRPMNQPHIRPGCGLRRGNIVVERGSYVLNFALLDFLGHTSHSTIGEGRNRDTHTYGSSA